MRQKLSAELRDFLIESARIYNQPVCVYEDSDDEYLWWYSQEHIPLLIMKWNIPENPIRYIAHPIEADNED